MQGLVRWRVASTREAGNSTSSQWLKLRALEVSLAQQVTWLLPFAISAIRCGQVLSWIVLVNFGVHHPVLTTISDPPLPVIHFLGIPSPSFSMHSGGFLGQFVES